MAKRSLCNHLHSYRSNKSSTQSHEDEPRSSEIQNNCLGKYTTKWRKLHQHLQYIPLLTQEIVKFLSFIYIYSMFPSFITYASSNFSKSFCRHQQKKYTQHKKNSLYLGGIICLIIQISYLNAQWRSRWCITINNIPIFINKELGEVPFDTIPKESTFARLQILVDWSSSGTIHINLIKNQINII